MKNLIFFVLILCGGIEISAQSKDWKQIEVPYTSSVNVLYQSSQGYLFGQMTVTAESVFSDNNGQSWQNLNSQFEYYFNTGFEEDLNGNIYFYENNNIYVFDTINVKFNMFLSITEYDYIEDIAFLKTGDIIVASDDELNLFGIDGKIKKKYLWNTHSAQILPDKINQKNYITNSIGASEYIVEFNDDLTYVSQKKSLPWDIYYSFIRIDDRIFSGSKYSDDGGTIWKKLNFLSDNIYDFNLGHDNKIYWIDGSNLFVSSDKGITYTKNPLQLEGNINYICASANGNIVVNWSECNNQRLFISDNYGVSWVEQDVEIGVPHTYGMFLLPMKDENLILGSCKWLIKKNNSNNWEPLTIETEEPFLSIYNVKNLSNNSLLYFDEWPYYLFKSDDLGATWQKINIDFDYVNNFNLIEKEGIIFLPGYDKLYFSYDFGTSWQSYDYPEDSYYFDFDGYFQLTKDFDYYYFDSETESFAHYNFKTNETELISLPFNYSDFSTTFNNQDLFFLVDEYGNNKKNIILYHSTDGGLTFTSRAFKTGVSYNEYYQLLVDNNNYIYLYNEKKIHISRDTGKTWKDISPDFPELISINALNVSFDDYIYLSTIGMGILKYNNAVTRTKEVTFDEIEIFPNPNNGVFTINVPIKSGNVSTIQIFDIHGNIIMKQKINDDDSRIDISEALSGTYFIKVVSGSSTYFKKIIKL